MVAKCPRCGSVTGLYYKGSVLRCRDCNYVEYDECKEDFYEYPDEDEEEDQ